MLLHRVATYLMVNSPALHWSLTACVTPTQTSMWMWMLEARLSHQLSHDGVVAAAVVYAVAAADGAAT